MALDLPQMPKAERADCTICCSLSTVKAPALEVAGVVVVPIEVVVA